MASIKEEENRGSSVQLIIRFDSDTVKACLQYIINYLFDATQQINEY